MIKKNIGYIAISTVLVIAAVLTVLVTSVTLISISEAEMSLSTKKGREATDFVESCVEDALIRINKNNSLPSSLILPEGTCSVTVDSHIGNDWTFTVTGTFDVYTKTIQVQATRGTQVTITSWKELV